MLFTRAALQHMLPRQVGSIINCSSISSLGGEFGLTAYSASKGSHQSVSRASVATQYGRSGIRCNGIAPGLIQSGSGRVSAERLKMYQRHHATPYLGEACGYRRSGSVSCFRCVQVHYGTYPRRRRAVRRLMRAGRRKSLRQQASSATEQLLFSTMIRGHPIRGSKYGLEGRVSAGSRQGEELGALGCR